MVRQSERWYVTKCHTASSVPQVPRLPRTWKVNVTKCHACHAKRRWMSPSAMPATPSGTAPRATQRATRASPVPQVPRLPRKTKVDVTKCHACHANTVASLATKRAQARHQSQPSAISATPATQNEGGCHQVPRMPREAKVDVGFAYAPSPQVKAASTPCAVPALSVIKNWVCTRSMPPHDSLRSGKHNLSAACPKERSTNTQKIEAKTISNAPQKLLFSWYLWYLVCFTNVLHGRKFNHTEMPKSKTKAYTDPKIAQDGST